MNLTAALRLLARAVLLLGLTAACCPAAVASAATASGWQAPLVGRLVVLRAFQPPPPGAPWRRGNRGVDLAASTGQSVLAAGAGKVSFAAPLAGRGVVVVDHGDLRTTYEPVEAVVRVGQEVEAGALLGRLEAPGVRCTARPCLHWGLLRGSAYLDPMSLLETRVRLLPLDSTVGMASRAQLAPAYGPVRALPPVPRIASAAQLAARAGAQLPPPRLGGASLALSTGVAVGAGVLVRRRWLGSG